MLVISVASTLAGFYYLIGIHVYQTVKLSEIKSLQIRAVTLAEIRNNELQVVVGENWSQAQMISGLVSNPSEVEDPEFAASLTHQRTEIVKASTSDETYKAVLVNDTYLDYWNN